MKVGEALVRLLEAYSVDTVFGIPGTHSIELYRGLASSSITHILPRHEQGAGFMADGYARITGKPGVCFVITGPGVTNIATAMGEAHSDSVPMLVISPVNDISELNRNGINEGRLHELSSQQNVTQVLTAFSETVSNAAQLPELLAKAFNLFATQRPRPVHLSIPLSVLQADVSDDDFSSMWNKAPIAMPPTADPIVIDQIVEMIRAAKSPVLVAGGGCRHFGEVVITLAEKLACPVVTTIAGRGAIQGTHPLCAGTQLATRAVQELIASSDLLLVFGSELAQTDHWQEALPLPVRQVWVNLDPNVPYQSGLANRANSGAHESDSVSGYQLCVVADAQSMLLELSRRFESPANDVMRDVCIRVKSYKNRHGEDFAEKQKRHWRVLTEIRKHTPHDLIVCSDMTQLAYTAIDNQALETPNSWFHPNGYGTLGYAVPAAIGVKCARQELPVLAIVGDAGIQYTMAEMAVAAELGLNVVVLLWQNDALLQISDDMDDAGFESMAVTQKNPDFQLLAQGFGWESEKISGLSRLGPALQAAFEGTLPVLLELLEETV